MLFTPCSTPPPALFSTLVLLYLTAAKGFFYLLAQGHSFPSNHKFSFYIFFPQICQLKYCPVCDAAKHISNSGKLWNWNPFTAYKNLTLYTKCLISRCLSLPWRNGDANRPVAWCIKILDRKSVLKTLLDTQLKKKMCVPFPKNQWYERIQQVKQQPKEIFTGKTQLRKHQDAVKKSMSFCYP